MSLSLANEKRFDNLAKEWDMKPARIKSAMIFVDKIFEVVETKQPNNNIDNFNVLDYGSGSGLVSFGMANKVNSILGLDNSNAMVEVYNNKATNIGMKNINAKKHDINNEELDKDLFDIAVTNMTMHHISDIKMFINKLSSSLKDDGMLFIADLISEDGRFHNDNTGVEHFGFEIDHVMDSFKQNGLKDINIEILHTIDKEHNSYDVFIAYGKK